MSIGESLKKGFSVAGQSWDIVVGLFLFGLIFNVLNVFISARLETPTPGAPVSVIAIVVGIVFIFLSIFVQAGMLGYVRDKIKSGSAGFGEFLAAGSRYYLKLFLLGLLVALIVGVVLALIAAVIFVTQQNPAAEVIGIVISVILGAVGVYISLLLFLSPYAVVADEKGPVAAIQTSVRTVRQNILQVLGLAVLLILIGFAFGIVLGLVLGLLSLAAKDQPQMAQLVFAVLSSAVNAYLGIFVAGSFMSFYLDLNRNSNSPA